MFFVRILNTHSHYDVAIIGAGMSGLAAGIRLAHFGRRVCIFERHNAVGGLNGFYSIAGRKFDVGLHAVTNFTPAGAKNTALTRILRQLRIERDEFALCPQRQCRITFGPLRAPGGSVSLRATNDFAFFESEVARVFPRQIDGFRAFAGMLRDWREVALEVTPVAVSAREVARRYITDPLLEDMIFCPVMYYGSPTEHDMDFSQFALLFRAIFFEGLARPLEGVRVILRVLLEKYRAAGGERRMKCGVQKILSRADAGAGANAARGLSPESGVLSPARAGNASASGLLLDDGTEITATHILSSIGAAETAMLIDEGRARSPSAPPGKHGALGERALPGRISYIETVSVLDRQPAALGWGDDTIVFFNEGSRFVYARPENAQVNAGGGTICIPNNFAYPGGKNLSEGQVRCTCLANYDLWKNLSDGQYRADKLRWSAAMLESATRFMPPLASADAPTDALGRATLMSDVFTPLTIERFTGHIGGAVYGSPVKNRQGRTALDNVYLCGTDQGFLGITGAMLSGISMANHHILQKSA